MHVPISNLDFSFKLEERIENEGSAGLTTLIFTQIHTISRYYYASIARAINAYVWYVIKARVSRSSR